MGGENLRVNPHDNRFIGSSPHGRGKREAGASCGQHGRLIPAWAGKTSASIVTMTFEPAHPRMGGENMQKAAEGAGRSGPSPHGRGKLYADVALWESYRLIPAWAGKTPG